MLPVGLTAKAIQLCVAGLAAGMSPAPEHYGIRVRAGAARHQAPKSEADAEATVRNLLAVGADFDAAPLAINGPDFATYGVTLASVFDACALSHIAEGSQGALFGPASSVSMVAALVRRAFGAWITDTIRPMNASHGARHSWHKFGQAVDVVPARGVTANTRDQIRALMGQSGIRLIKLLGPGDRGHSTHSHIAFARPGQVIDRAPPIEEDKDWIVNMAQADAPSSSTAPLDAAASSAPASSLVTAVKARPQWHVFGREEWRAAHGGGS